MRVWIVAVVLACGGVLMAQDVPTLTDVERSQLRTAVRMELQAENALMLAQMRHDEAKERVQMMVKRLAKVGFSLDAKTLTYTAVQR